LILRQVIFLRHRANLVVVFSVADINTSGPSNIKKPRLTGISIEEKAGDGGLALRIAQHLGANVDLRQQLRTKRTFPLYKCGNRFSMPNLIKAIARKMLDMPI
jgi:hypothetical protein